MRSAFSAPEHEAAFERDGYVLVRGLAADLVEDAATLFRDTSSGLGPGFHYSFQVDAPDRKALIHDQLASLFAGRLEQVLGEYEPLTCVFVSKGTGPSSEVAPHQDWSFVDEHQHTSLNAWIPLCDTSAENGALALVKRSNRLPFAIRGTYIPVAAGFSRADLGPHLTTVSMRAGDALIYDHRMIHTSEPNRSDERRTAATLNLRPKEATAVHYVGVGTDTETLTELQVAPSFFHRYTLGSETSDALDPVFESSNYPAREVTYSPVSFSLSDLAALESGRKRRFRWARAARPSRSGAGY
jgi:Phytanoyl-CoA dioxygenase (PhyH)